MNILDAGFRLTLRPMRYPQFYDHYINAIKNTWTVEEVDFSSDREDLTSKITDGERHMINRLVAFFATGDSIVSNNLVLNFYKHINSPEARMYLSRQLYEEALHVQFYLTLLDTYLPDPLEREQAFSAVDNIPSVKRKAEFCFKWMDSVQDLDELKTMEDKRKFILNLVCFASCVEGLFFFAAFAYVYFLRSRGLLNGLATGTNWVFRDETMHMGVAFEVIDVACRENPGLWNDELEDDIRKMMAEAIECEVEFSKDALSEGISGLSPGDMRTYLECVADQRMARFGMKPVYGSANPFPFMELQDVQELTNFFERRVSAYQHGVSGEVDFTTEF